MMMLAVTSVVDVLLLLLLVDHRLLELLLRYLGYCSHACVALALAVGRENRVRRLPEQEPAAAPSDLSIY